MLLTPSEQDRLLLFSAAQLARARRARGLRLNVPEAIAVVADTVCEVARDGGRHADALAAGRAVLGPADVLPGVAEVVTQVAVEAVFDDGCRLVVVPDPIGAADDPVTRADPAGGTALVDDPAPVDDPVTVAGPENGTALASGMDLANGMDPASGVDPAVATVAAAGPAPGAVLPGSRVAAVDADVIEVEVLNTAAVPVSVTSHFHFFEANPRLRFDRAAAYGRHLLVPPGSSIRFDPQTPVRVTLVPFAGDRVVVGFSGLVDGPLDAPGMKQAALDRAREFGFLGAEQAAEPAAEQADGTSAAGTSADGT